MDSIDKRNHYAKLLSDIDDIEDAYSHLKLQINRLLDNNDIILNFDAHARLLCNNISKYADSDFSGFSNYIQSAKEYCQKEKKRYEIIYSSDKVYQIASHYDLKLEENKYNLKPSDIHSITVIDWDRLKNYTWLNTALSPSCWCHLESTEHDEDDFWIGFYSSSKVECYFSSYEGMCGYEFSSFYDSESIENKFDIEIQSKFLRYMNNLLDSNIIALKRD